MNSSSSDADRLGALAPFLSEATDRFGALPVAIRDESYAVVQRSTVGALLEAVPNGFAPGQYLLNVPLPQGGSLLRGVAVGADGSVNAGGLADALEAVRAAVEERRGDISSGIPAGLQAMGAKAPAARREVKLKVRCFEGPPLRLPGPRRLDTDDIVVRREGRRVLVGFSTGSGGGVVQVLRAGWQSTNIVVAPGVALALSIQPYGDPDEGDLGVLVEPRFGVPVADELSGLRSTGRLAEIKSIVSRLSADEIKRRTAGHAGAALAIGYALVRSAPETARQVARDLRHRMPDSPDAAILVAELNALEGGEKHWDALLGFLEAHRLGLPASTHGLNYLLERLRHYTRIGKGGRAMMPRLGSALLQEAEQALEDVQRFSFHCDFSSVMTCYSGIDPDEPASEELEQDTYHHVCGKPITLEGDG